MSRSVSRTMVSGGVLAAVTVMTAVLGPAAGADVVEVSVAAGPESLLAGCRYTVTAKITDSAITPGSVFFVLSGGVIPGNGERIPGAAVHHPENNTVTASWTPTRVGRQNLVGMQSEPGKYTSSKFITVEVVGNGLDTGSSCLKMP